MSRKIVSFDFAMSSTESEMYTNKLSEQRVYTNDTNSVELEFNITDVTPDYLPSVGANAMLYIYMADGSFFVKYAQHLKLDQNRFYYVLTPEEVKRSGMTKVQLIILIGEMEIASPLFDFKIVNGLVKYPIRPVEIRDWDALTTQARLFVEDLQDLTAEEFAELKMDEKLINLERDYAGRLQSTENQLKAKVDKGNVSVSDININLGKLDQRHISDELIAQIAGDAAVNAVPAPKSITSDKVADGAVTFDKLSNIVSRKIGYKNYTFINGQFTKSAPGYVDGNFETGYIDSAIRLVTSNLVYLKKGDTIKLNNPSYAFSIHTFDEDGKLRKQATAWRTTDLKFTMDAIILLQLKKVNDSTISVGNEAYEAVQIEDGSLYTYPVQTNVLENSLFINGYFNRILSGYKEGIYETGIDETTTTRCITSTLISVKKGQRIKIKNSQFKYTIHYFNADETLISQGGAWLTREITFSSDNLIAVQLAKKDDSVISISNYDISSIIELNTYSAVGAENIELESVGFEHLDQSLKNVLNMKSKEVDLIMFMGQSNMSGRGDASEAPIVQSGTGYEFKAISDPTKLYEIKEPFGVNENNAVSGVTEMNKTGSMISALTNAYYDKTGRVIVGVSCSKGGTSIDFWKPGGGPLTDAISRKETAENWLVENSYIIKSKSMVWCQGETDGDNAMSPEQYKSKFSAMVSEMFSNGIENCYLVRIGNNRDNATLYDGIIQAQTDIAKELNNVIMVSTKFDRMATDGLMKDPFHYFQDGYNIVGEDAGINIAYHVNTGKEPTMYDWENQSLYYSHK